MPAIPLSIPDLAPIVQGSTPGQAVQAVPGAGLQVPIWLLGSSLFSAELAGELGLPYAFASHFAPRFLLQAIALYRRRFKPSAALEEPYVMVAANAIAADSDEAARHLFTSLRNRFALMARGVRGALQPPSDTYEASWSPRERAFADDATACSAVGSPATIRAGLEALVARTGADELMLTAHIFDHAARLRSFEIVAEAWGLPAPDQQ